MSNKRERISKALKNDGVKSNCFFKAFFTCIAVSTVVLLVLCTVASAALSGKDDSTGSIDVLSYVFVALSLVIGGFAGRKTAGCDGIAPAFISGCAMIGICYALSCALSLGGKMELLEKTLHMAIMLICPVLGAKIAAPSQKTKRRKR